MKIKEHRLIADNIQWQESANCGAQFARGKPDSIVIHYTAGSSSASSARSLCRANGNASAHLVIGRDDEDRHYQLVPFNRIAWHAGNSNWAGRSGYNRYSIGIEIDNAGPLEANDNGKFFSWFNKSYPPEEVFKGTHRNEATPRYWHRYSERQLETVFDICELLCQQYPIKEILGHEEISPGRKTDPGPAFPLERLRNRLLGPGRSEEEAAETSDLDGNIAIVTANKLNIRKGPGSSSALAAAPLKNGTEIEILEEKAGWTRVRHCTEGWVSSRYLSRG